MSWWNRFGGSLVFALLVAGSYPLYLGFAGLALGSRAAFALYLLLSAGLYLFGIARRPSVGLGAALAVFATGVLGIFAGASLTQLALVTGLLIGVLRSGLVQRTSRSGRAGFARRFVREALLIGGGLGLAAYLAAGSSHPQALGLWGFYLVQSGFFLISEGSPRGRGEHVASVRPDAFDQAVKRAREVLNENPGAAS